MSANAPGCGACRTGQHAMSLTMAFQPVVDLDLSRIDAYEALVRGAAGEPAAQVLGSITPATRYSFDQTCRETAISLAAELRIDRQLNINFMPNAVYNPKTCIRATLAAAARSGFPLDHITFEIVEDERVRDVAHLAGIIAEYRRHGFRVALDDFSTGYSGLSLLAELKPDIVKLDRALIRACDMDRDRLAIVAAMLALGRQLGIKMVCEGAEREGEVRALRSAGARFIQGFFFARPLLRGVVRDHEIPWLRQPELVAGQG